MKNTETGRSFDEVKTNLKILGAAFLALALTFTGWAGEKAKGLKVLMIGNSFSICVLKEMPKIASDLGLNLDICSLYIGGCSLERHATNMKNPDSHPYLVTWSYRSVSGEAVPFKAALTYDAKRKKWHGNIPAMLAGDKWDIVTIQQASPFSWRPESYEPYGTELLAEIAKRAPQAKVYVQQTWSYTPWDGRLAKWGFDQDEMFKKLEKAYDGFAKAHGLPLIRMGEAVQMFRKATPKLYGERVNNDVCGTATFKQKEGAWKPDGDVFHLNAKGAYLQGLVWTAKLFGADVTKSSYVPKCLAASPHEAESMRKIAARVSVAPSRKFKEDVTHGQL